MKKFSVFNIAMFAFVVMYAEGNDTLQTASGLKIIFLNKGYGNTFQKGDKIKVHFEAKLCDGSFVESTKSAGMAFRFFKGDQNIIEGWNEAFNYLREGDRALVIVPAQLGYGDVGLLEPGTKDVYLVPPGQDIHFEINKIALVKTAKNHVRTFTTAKVKH